MRDTLFGSLYNRFSPFYIIALFLLFACLYPSNAYAAKFNIGDTVEVYNTGGIGLNLRSCPDTSCTVMTIMTDGTKMTVKGGPYYGNGYTWWYLYGYVNAITSSNGTYYPAGYYYGYAVEDYLRLVITPCTYSISPTSKSFTSNGGSDTVSVTASSGSCSWTATSNAFWITITSGSSGIGNGTVYYTVSANTSSSPRTGTMTIAGQTFTVTQSGVSTPPTVTTGTYQIISSSSAQLFGTVNPNGLPTTGWFQWGTTNSYGNTTSAESLGGGTSVVQMLHTISGLSPNTTYHFRAVAQNSAGTSYGDDMAFTTPPPPLVPPTVTTEAATSVSSSSATLNGTVNPNGSPTTGWFEWGTTASYGNTTPTFSGGSGTSPVTMSWPISGLSPNTTYHFRAVGQNGAGTAYGSDMSFTTGSCTYSINPNTQSFAANGGDDTVYVTTSSSTCSWTATSNANWITITSGSSGTGDGTVNYSVSSNSSTSPRTGTMIIAGQTFTVTQSGVSTPPTVTTGTYQIISSSSAQLFGTVNPNGLSTDGWFEWGTTISYGNKTDAQSLGNGTSVVQMLHTISELSPNTTYHFRAVGKNSAGTSYGEDMTFTIPPPPTDKPTVTTGAATSITETSATLNGTINPNGSPTTAWFEWGLTTSFGNKTTELSGGSGTDPVPMSSPISGLFPNTTYYYRVVAKNGAGTTYGNEMSFKTQTSNKPPIVTTGSASNVTSNAATLNGTVNANGLSTTAWFQYGVTSGSYTGTSTTQSVSGSSDTSVSIGISGLLPLTTYYYRFVAQSSAGTTYGSEMYFTTLHYGGTPSPTPTPSPSPTPSPTVTPTPTPTTTATTTPTVTITPTPIGSPTPTPTVTKTPTATPTPTPEEEDLLEKYAPILYMHKKERFHPTDVDTMLDNSKLEMVGLDLLGITVYKNKDNSLTTDMLINDYNSNEYYLQLKKKAKDTLEDNKKWKTKQTVYGRMLDSEGDVKKVLQYWFFYIYNDWGKTTESGNSHEGDWEMIQIVLDEGGIPEQITYGYHHGGETFEWKDIEKSRDGNHPKVYVTLGGHGCWNTPGDHIWYQEIATVCTECVDETSDDGDVIYPNFMSKSEVDASAKKYPYIMVSLSLAVNPETDWIYWLGYWGNQVWVRDGVVDLGKSGPSSPPYIDYTGRGARWYYPLNWAAVPLPESYTICSSDNSKVVIVNLEESSKGEYCSNFKDSYKSFTEIIYSDEDLTFDVYSLDGKPVDLKISRFKRTGEEYLVEFNGLRIPRRGKATLFFSPEQNPQFKIGIDRNNDGKIDRYKLPDTMMAK